MNIVSEHVTTVAGLEFVEKGRERGEKVMKFYVLRVIT